MTDQIQRFIKQCSADRLLPQFPEVRAVMVGGSVGRGEADPLSDLDLFILIDNCDRSSFLMDQMPRFMRRLGALALHRGPILVPRSLTA